jgi:hypothetical protein
MITDEMVARVKSAYSEPDEIAEVVALMDLSQSLLVDMRHNAYQNDAVMYDHVGSALRIRYGDYTD